MSGKSRFSTYQACRALGSFARKKTPPIPVTFAMRCSSRFFWGKSSQEHRMEPPQTSIAARRSGRRALGSGRRGGARCGRYGTQSHPAQEQNDDQAAWSSRAAGRAVRYLWTIALVRPPGWVVSGHSHGNIIIRVAIVDDQRPRVRTRFDEVALLSRSEGRGDLKLGPCG